MRRKKPKPRQRRTAKAAAPRKRRKAQPHRFGHFIIPRGCRVTGFANWQPTDDVPVQTVCD